MGSGKSKSTLLIDINGQIEQTKNQKVKLEQEIEVIKAENIKQEAKDLETLAHLKKEREELEDKKQKLDEKLKTANPSMEHARTQVHNLEHTKKATKSECKQLTITSNEAENEKLAAQTKMNAVLAEVKKLEDAKAAVEKKIHNLEGVENRCEEEKNQIGNFELEISEKEKIIEDLNERKKLKIEENHKKDELKGLIKEQKEATVGLAKHIPLLIKDIAKQEEIHKKLVSKEAEIENLSKEIDTAQVTQEERNLENNLIQEIEAKKAEIIEATEMNARRKALADKLAALLAHQNDLNSKTAKVSSEIVSIQHDIEKRKHDEEVALNKKLTDKIRKIDNEITDKNEEFTKELEPLTAKIEKIQNKWQHRKEEVDTLRQALAAALQAQKDAEEALRMREEAQKGEEGAQKAEEEAQRIRDETARAEAESQRIRDEAEAEAARAEAEAQRIRDEAEAEAQRIRDEAARAEEEAQRIRDEAARAGAESHQPQPTHELSSLPPPTPIRYGVPIKLRHVRTGHALHSQPIHYATGTKQQEATCFGSRDENNWWVIKGIDSKKQRDRWGKVSIGTQVENKSVIRLEHTQTRRNLHSSPGIPSPSSGQQEVSCFGEHGIGDNNDNWRIEIEGLEGNEPWSSEMRVRFIHAGTDCALHSHAEHVSVSGQQEITCYQGRDENDFWIVEDLA